MASSTPSNDQISSGASWVGASRKAVFRKDGEYWTVGCEGSTSRLKETRGLRYIAYLLRYPHIEFNALDLYGGIAGPRGLDESSQPTTSLLERAEDLEKSGIYSSGLGDAGEMLDEQAKAAYLGRISELQNDLEQAKRVGRIERAEQVEEEIDSLTRELSRAVGLSGRIRRAASASERARQSVTKSIKSALEKIVQSDVTLGDHLLRCIKTGNFCVYRPDSASPFNWAFAANLEEVPTSKSDPSPERPALRPVPQAVLNASPFPLAERTAFVGRQAEREAIRAIIDRALSGRGSLVMLAGGPGVGKSRLAIEMLEYALRVGFRCGVGHCYERHEPYPYLPFVEIIEGQLAQAASLDDFRHRMGDNAAELAQLAPSLRRFFPDIPQPVELLPSQKRRYIFQSISELLARSARTRSYVYVLEDLHWADESTLALLIHLANRITQLPVVLIATYRDTYLESSEALIRTTEELIRMGVRPIKIDGLSKDAVREMLNELSKRQTPQNLVKIIFDETQGNPFFIEEMYRHLREEKIIFDTNGQLRDDIAVEEIDLPANVRLVIDRRLGRFQEEEKRVLAAAAVIGRSFSFQLLAEISRTDMDVLFGLIEKARQMGIIVSSAEGPDRPFTFSHELVRQTLLAGIVIPRQQSLHAAVAQAIERLHSNSLNERAGDIADHLLKAGPFADESRLVNFLTLAGKNAIESAAFETALLSFGTAVSHLIGDDSKQRADLLMGIAISERGLERWEAAYAHLGEAFEIYLTLGDRKKIAASGTELARLFMWAGRFEDAAGVVRRALDRFEANWSTDRAYLLGVLGSIQGARGNWKAAHEAQQEALSVASELSDSELTSRLYGDRSITDYEFLLLKEAIHDSEFARGVQVSPWERALQQQILYQTLLLVGRIEEAHKLGQEVETLATRIGQSYSIARILMSRAWVEFGASGALFKLGTTVREIFNSDPKIPQAFWGVLAEAQLSFLNFFRGDWSSALAHAQASNNAREDTFIRGFGAGTLFRQLAYAGDRVGAMAILEQKREWLPRAGQPNTMGSWWMLVLAIEGLFVLGEKQQAAELYPLACELEGNGAVALWAIFRFTQTALGIAATAARMWDAAEAHFQTSLQQAETIPHRLEQAEIRRFRAMMLIDRRAPGDHEKAQTLLDEAIRAYETIGMSRHKELVRTLRIKLLA